jgi:hypothetical protein
VTKSNQWWLLGGVVFLLWLESRKKPGGETYMVPMPDWTRPEFDPKAIEMPAQKTPATFEQMRSAFMRGYRDVTGDAPPDRVLLMFLAVSAQETDEWRSMWWWNPVNLTTIAKRGYFYIPNDPDHLKYAPFPDARTGAAATVKRFAEKFPRSFGAMLASSPETVAQTMKQEGFYTGPADAYARRVRGFFDKFAAAMPGAVT